MSGLHEIQKTKLRPSVGFSLSKGIHILHIIDHATRFSAAAVVKSKKKKKKL